MHYYQFNIGDYLSHTKHLDVMEDLAYRRLLDLYYLHERPLNSGIASVARQIGMRDHENEVKSVLEEFFHLSQDGWINDRANKEIKHFHSKIDQASRAGKASAERRMSARSTDVQLTNNHKPVTNNQELLTSTSKTKTVAQSACNRPEGVLESLWDDFLTLRKAKKAPLTASALKGIEREAKKAGMNIEEALYECCARGWTGFKAEWIKKEPFDVGSATRKILERELEKEARLVNPWDSKEIQ